ncbi:CGLD27 family protein [Mastigocoleus testarum]|uniref:DUF1230 domain-containing protein n=1 Tax=Mastigocoleus testarum BC008 TaxID=371196 RepID=A0A0V7ZP84_9CYAN|nr:CGLD27 family protein [Mastigocoleus testarum]KST66257.1 hypothetical protein BC008_25140 [Mastigocoleus testarum BC008]
MIRSSVFNCPVPTEQQPLNEYEELKSSWLFRDCTLTWRKYITKIIWAWGLSLIFAAPVAATSFPLHKDLSHFLLSSAAGGSVGVILLLTRLYLGWSYIRSRLYSPIIFYEESGWYDGHNWAKPQDILDRDRLIVSYEIRPILQRIKLTFVGLVGLFIAGSIVWQLL